MPDTHDTSTRDGPYAVAAPLYWAAGWHGVLPIPARAKQPVPTGYTGASGAYPSRADVQAWVEDRGAGNVALRLPHHVIGLDVDAYDSKPGARTLAALVEAHGPLPATWRSTSRDDGVSGIRLYQVPSGLAWPGELPGGGIEVIQHRHRYAVAWPSVHPNGGRYRWIGPDDLDRIGEVPHVDDLPDLPDAWVAALTGGAQATDVARARLPQGAAQGWLAHKGAGTPCRAVRNALTRAQADLAQSDGPSRHGVALRGTARLTHLAAEGHTGSQQALEQLRTAFVDAIDVDAHRPHDPGEFRRLVLGAVDVAAARSDQSSTDPCTDPFAGLLTQPAPLETTWTPLSTSAPAPASPATTAPTTTVTASPGTTAMGTQVPAPASTDQPDDEAEQVRTSWWPVDLEPAITGDNPEPPPVHLHRADGVPLVYAGKVNGLLGESESAKSWVALHAVAQALGRGQSVTYLDFEDTATGIVGRLQALGVDDGHVRAHLRYIGPDQMLDAVASADLQEHLAEHEPSLVVLDGVNAAMTLLGLDLVSNMDATRFAQAVLRPLTRSGAAVLYVDHVPKNNSDTPSKGGIGAQAKRAMTTGSAFRVEVVQQPAPGQKGRLRLRVDKDRPGYVRGESLPGATGWWAGDVVFTPAPHRGERALDITLDPPHERDDQDGAQARSVTFEYRVCDALQGQPEGLSGRELEKAVKGRAVDVRAVLAGLVERRHIMDESRSGNGARWVLLRHVAAGQDDDELQGPSP